MSERNYLLADSADPENQAEKNGKKSTMTNEELRESGCMEGIVKAMEHYISDIPEVDVVEAYKTIEEGVVGTYQKIEDGVVSGYKKIEDGAVSGFTRIADKFVEVFFTKEGETVEEAKARLRGEE